MPWRAEKSSACPASKPWGVLDPDGQVVGCHETETAAARQVAALYANVEEAYSPKQPRDKLGRFAGHGVMSTGEVLSSLAKGQQPSIAPGQVTEVLRAAADRNDDPDLTDLKVEGTLKFGGDGLGFARTEMPVLGSAHLPGYIANVRSRDIKVSDDKVEPQDLKPMQSEVSARSVGKMMKGMEAGTMPEKPVVVSSDNFVVDGHHRWGAATAISFDRPGMTIPVIRIDMDGRTLRTDALSWNAQQGISPKAIGEALLEHVTGPQHGPKAQGVHAGGSADEGLALGTYSEEQKQAMSRYQYEGQSYNDKLRGLSYTSGPSHARTVKGMDEAIAATPALTEDLIVYRGISHDFKGGKDKGFPSTTTDPEKAKFFAKAQGGRKGKVLTILVPKGSHVLPLDRAAIYERRGQKFDGTLLGSNDFAARYQNGKGWRIQDMGDHEVVLPRNGRFTEVGNGEFFFEPA